MLINLVDEGAVGDGTTDNHAVIQGVLDAAPQGSQIYLPNGEYVTSNTLDFGTYSQRFIGDCQGRENLGGGGSRLIGNFAGPLLKCGYPSVGSSFSDLVVHNIHAAGTGMLVGGTNTSIERVFVHAFKGIATVMNTFMLSIHRVVARWNAHTTGSVGIQVVGHSSIQAVDCQGFDHAIRVGGMGNGLRDLRLEVNKVGLYLGLDGTGTPLGIMANTIESVSMEANDVGIYVKAMNSSRLQAIYMQGSINSPSAESTTGIVIENIHNSSFANCYVTGSYSVACVRALEGSGVTRDTLLGITMNNIHATGKKFDKPAGWVNWGAHA